MEEFVPEAEVAEKVKTDRVTAAYKELLSGYNEEPSTILKVVDHVKDFNGLVCEKNIKFQSMCQHHFLPFIGTISVVYEPGEVIVGLGKISRFVHALAKRLQFQERLTQQIAEEFMRSAQAKGVYVYSTAVHLCMGFRGPSDPNAEASCFYALGTLNDPSRQVQINKLLEIK